MKRYFKSVLGMLVVFALCAFVGGLAVGEALAAVPVPKSNTIYDCAGNQANEFSLMATMHCVKLAKEFGWDVITLDAQSDMVRQISNVETAIGAGAAAIILDPVSSDGLSGVLLTAVNSGIPVICILGYTTNQDQLTAHVTPGYTRAGELKMEQVAADLGGKGRIAIIRSTEGHSVANMITDGYYNVLKNFPDIEVVYFGTGDWSAPSATPLAETWLTADPNLDAIVCNNDGMALGVRPVIESMGLEDKVKLYGLDAVSEARSYVRGGGCFKATVMIDIGTIYRRSFEIIEKFYKGENFDKYVNIDSVVITAENINEYFPND